MEVAERLQTSEDKAETFSAGDYLNTLDKEFQTALTPIGRPSNNIIAIVRSTRSRTVFWTANAFDAMIDAAAEEAAAGPRRRRRGGGPAGGRGPQGVRLTRRSCEAMIETKLDTTMEAIEAAAVPMEEVSFVLGEFLIKWGFRDDPQRLGR